MELEIPKNCPEELLQVFQTLIDARQNVCSVITTLLSDGECSYLSHGLYGYPYDYKGYAKDSLDPNVQILNRLVEKIEEAFEERKKENLPDQSDR